MNFKRYGEHLLDGMHDLNEQLRKTGRTTDMVNQLVPGCQVVCFSKHDIGFIKLMCRERGIHPEDVKFIVISSERHWHKLREVTASNRVTFFEHRFIEFYFEVQVKAIISQSQALTG